MDQSTLKEILAHEMAEYGGLGANSIGMLFYDEENNYYVVGDVTYPKKVWPPAVFMIALLVGDKIIIEEDGTDKPLVDALLQRGVPRDQIILAYRGEQAHELEALEWMPAI